MEIREPLYLAVADVTITTNGRSSQEVAQEIYRLYTDHDQA